MKKISVLIVEDDQFITNAYKYKFEEVGFNVKSAFNGDEALEILKKFIPDNLWLKLLSFLYEW